MTLEDLAFPPSIQDDVLTLTGHARAHVSASGGGGDQNRGKSLETCMDTGSGVVPKTSFSPTSDPAKINIERDTKTHPQNILALDLGTKTGYALRRRDGTIIHGTEIFTPRKSWSPGQKWQRYRTWLSALIVREQVHVIVYEEVRRHAGTLAAHAYGGFLAMLEMTADQHNVELRCEGVGGIKKAWTGKGNADKDAMIAEARRRGFRVADDNNADALAILFLAVMREEV